MEVYKSYKTEVLQTIMYSLIVVVALIAAGSTEPFSYLGYKVYRVFPHNKDQLNVLASFRNNKHVDFWSPLPTNVEPIDVMIDPYINDLFLQQLKRNSIKYEVLINDVESIVENERLRQLLSPKIEEGKISFTQYHRHDEINAYLDQLAKDYPNTVSVETIGKSYEGRNMKVIKISSDPTANKPVIFIDAGIHAREWIAPPVALYTINQLVENPENINLLEKVDWLVLPILNPDGYEYTHVGQRFWRKTRSPGIKCNGTDGNRNYDFHWAETGSSADECQEDYHGTHPASEVETVAHSNYIAKLKNKIKLYLTFHSYGKYILYPWGYTAELPENSDELQALGEAVAKSIEEVDGSKYTIGSSTNVLYAAAGGSDDWVKGVAGVELSYTIELPGGGWYGFNPPPTKILPIVTETWPGIRTYHAYIADKYGK